MKSVNPVIAAGLGAFATPLIAATPVSASDETVETSYFEGRWAFAEETCDRPTNWTFDAGGDFQSQDLTGSWQWTEGRLELNLVDQALDEETGEAGGRFQMEGPVQIAGDDQFSFIIEPDSYILKRC